MIKFLDGPATGQVLMLRCAPALMRVVQKPNGGFDGLDRPGDTPAPDEKIFVYRRIFQPTTIHLRMSRGRGGYFMSTVYELCPQQPTDDVMRDPSKWLGWCETEKKAFVHD